MSDIKSFLKSKGFVINFPVFILEGGLKLKMPAFLLRGPPGVGKTELTRLVAEFLDAKYIFYQCTLNTSEDDLLYRYVPSEKTKSGIKVLPSVLPQALEISKKEKVVVVLDEFDKTRPSADALLLDFLQNARVSARFESEREIIGKPENLVVFLTSNDMREFSEPLLRRVIQLRLEPLPPSEVANILKGEGFDEGLIKLLVKIYQDTYGANLRKPATIQELKQLGYIIQQNPHADLDSLIESIIIKYDEDLEAYKTYLATNRTYESFQPKKDYFITNHYMNVANSENSTQPAPQAPAPQAPPVNQIIELLKIKKPDAEITPPVAGGDEDVVYLKAKDSNREAYTEVIRTFRPEPTDDPTKFGKYELKLDNGVPYVITKKPLTFSELKLDLEGEGYARFRAVFNAKYLIDRLIDIADKIKYYTKDVIAIEIKQISTLILIRYSAREHEMEIYFNGKAKTAYEHLNDKLINSQKLTGIYTYCENKKLALGWIIENLPRFKETIDPDMPIVIYKDKSEKFDFDVSLDELSLTVGGKCAELLGDIKTFGELVAKVEELAKTV